MSLLETRGLKRYFGGLKAVDDVDFSLDAGEIRAVIGPNGAGKTTLVSLLCGRLAPTAGTILFRDRDVTRLPAHKRVALGIAYTFQITNVYPNLSAFDNVALAVQSSLGRHGGLLAPIHVDVLRRKVQEALDAVGLAARAAEKAGELAYGHQRLIEVAMGLALEPAVLILDEPTQGLSDPEIADFCALVRRIAETATILLIEHNMDVVMQLAHRITVMNQGQILAEGDPQAIRDNADVQSAYLGT